MIIHMDDEEYERFIKYATSTDKSQGEKWDRLRRRFESHTDAKKIRELTQEEMKSTMNLSESKNHKIYYI